jgi:hypothetical protein
MIARSKIAAASFDRASGRRLGLRVIEGYRTVAARAIIRSYADEIRASHLGTSVDATPEQSSGACVAV